MVEPNVVWITLDSVRADHTTPGGAQRDTTPNLQAVADSPEGNYHDECISHGRWSLTSIPSMLTGTWPSYHQLGFENKQLVDEVPTIAELFKDVGYTTAALSRNPHLSHETHLDRGFDRFEYIQASDLIDSVGLKTTIKYLANIRRHSAGFERDKYAHSTPYLVNDVAKRWVRDFENKDAPFFFCLHYNEPHTPYYPPLPYLGHYDDAFETEPRTAAKRAVEICKNKDEHIATGFAELTEEDWNILLAMYDAEIRYTDEMVGKLISYIKSHSDRETIFVITADHGDLFGEYGVFAHALVLHDGLIHVPLITEGLGIDDDFVQHADIVRTIGEQVGIDTTSLQGLDLRSDHREFAIAQNKPVTLDEYHEFNPEFNSPHYITDSYSDVLRTQRWKYRRSDNSEALFELPNQERDVKEQYPDVVLELREKLDEWHSKHDTVSERSSAEYSDTMKERLKHLGYHE